MSVAASYENLKYSFRRENEDWDVGRIRLFVWVDNTDFSATSADLYDNWNTDFRPSRIDNHKFNKEIVIPWSGTDAETTFSHPISDESESYLEPGDHVNPVNILVETQESTCEIESITYENGLVTIVTSVAHGFDDGDAVAIESLPGVDNTEASYVGPDGLRLRGTFKIRKVDGCTFTYYTAFASTTVKLTGAGGKVSKYSVIQYTDSPVLLMGNRIVYPEGTEPSYDVGDIVSTSTVVNSSVLNVDSGVVTLNVDLPQTRSGEEGSAMYSPRTPSAAVPANYDTDTDNASLYDHTENTKVIRPSIDTYFTSADSYHQGEDEMKCGTGNNESVACMTFNVGGLNLSDGLSAILRLYVSSMNYSELVLTIYQMSTAFWSPADSIETIASNITALPLNTTTLKNPALRKYNDADITELTDTGDYGVYVDFQLDPLVIDKWISNDPNYPASIAIKVTGDGSPYVAFGTNEAFDYNKDNRPQLIISGGEESTVEDDLFDIVTTASSVEPGERLCIMALGEGSFGNAPFNNVVKLDGKPVSIDYGTEDRMYVIVPDDISGSVDVVVYRKMNSTGTENQITNPTIVYVKNDSYSRDIKLNEKIPAGVIKRKTSRSALYNRDLGFSNFTEITDETSLIQNVYSILLTRKGERLFEQNFGTRIEDSIFKLGYEYSEVDLLKECIEAVEKYEPRVTIDGDRSSCDFDDSGTYHLTLCVILPTARQEMIKFTFKNRGQVV